MKTALFVDEAHDPRSPSTKHALFVDDASKMSRLSTKTSLSVDGEDKEMQLVCLRISGLENLLEVWKYRWGRVYLRDYKP